jgi:hypothetical protein
MPPAPQNEQFNLGSGLSTWSQMAGSMTVPSILMKTETTEGLNDPLGVMPKRPGFRINPRITSRIERLTRERSWRAGALPTGREDTEHILLNEKQVAEAAAKRKKDSELVQHDLGPGLSKWSQTMKSMEIPKPSLEIKKPTWALGMAKKEAEAKIEADRAAVKKAQQSGQLYLKQPDKKELEKIAGGGAEKGGGFKNKKSTVEIESQQKRVDAAITGNQSTNRGGGGTGDEGNISTPTSNLGNSDPPGPGDSGTGPYMECFI